MDNKVQLVVQKILQDLAQNKEFLSMVTDVVARSISSNAEDTSFEFAVAFMDAGAGPASGLYEISIDLEEKSCCGSHDCCTHKGDGL